MNKNLVKTKDGRLFEIQGRVSSPTTDPVVACFAISGYDGMPIGQQIWIGVNELTDEDRERTIARLDEIPLHDA